MSNDAADFGRALLGGVAPKLADLTADTLFGDVWKRSDLSPRDRSLITVASLVTQDRPAQLRFHVAKALENGISRTELGELVTHLAFYAGWPAAVSAVAVIQSVFEEADSTPHGNAAD